MTQFTKELQFHSNYILLKTVVKYIGYTFLMQLITGKTIGDTKPANSG